jgi:hypothetical protein
MRSILPSIQYSAMDASSLGSTAAPSVVLVVGDVRVVVAVVVVRAGLMMMRAAGLPLALQGSTPMRGLSRRLAGGVVVGAVERD